MKLAEARHECQRYLNYLSVQEAKSLALQRLASDRRNCKCDDKEKARRMKDIMGPSPTVYDGARLAEAIKVLMKVTTPTIQSTGGKDD